MYPNIANTFFYQYVIIKVPVLKDSSGVDGVLGFLVQGLQSQKPGSGNLQNTTSHAKNIHYTSGLSTLAQNGFTSLTMARHLSIHHLFIYLSVCIYRKVKG